MKCLNCGEPADDTFCSRECGDETLVSCGQEPSWVARRSGVFKNVARNKQIIIWNGEFAFIPLRRGFACAAVCATLQRATTEAQLLSEASKIAICECRDCGPVALSTQLAFDELQRNLEEWRSEKNSRKTAALHDSTSRP